MIGFLPIDWGQDIWTTEVRPRDSPWWKKVMAIRDEVRDLVPHSFLLSLFGISRKERVNCVYELLHVGCPVISWHHWVWHRLNLPRACFVSWLLCHERLKTKDCMSVYLPTMDLTCVLCGETSETCRHLFFECGYSRVVLKEILGRLELPCDEFSLAFWNYCFSEARHTQNAI